MGDRFPFLKERNPLTGITREFTKDEQKGKAKWKAKAAKPKEKSKIHPGVRSGLESWGHSRHCGPSKGLIGERSCCSFLWHRFASCSGTAHSWSSLVFPAAARLLVRGNARWVHLASPEREPRKENSEICDICSQLPPSPGWWKNISIISAMWAIRLQTVSIVIQPLIHRVFIHRLFHLKPWAPTQSPTSI